MVEKYKELFGAVLNHSICGIYPYEVDRVCQPTSNIIAIGYKNVDGWKHYNIHELAHKCKEWILAEGYSFFSYSDDNSEWYAQCKLVTTDIQPLTWSVADTEPDAIFEAAEWVRQQKEN